MLKVDILTLFPNILKGPFDESIIKRAVEDKKVEVNVHNLRDWTSDKHQSADDRPYGGGAGMVLMVKPLYKALEALKKPKSHVVLMSPQGTLLTQSRAQKMAKLDHLILICGRYEGVDERVRKYLIDTEISIGDYVLSGGELPAAVLVETLVRLVPGVLKKEEATVKESFVKGMLDYPHYTRPEEFKGWKVPEVLLSGDHKKIADWRAKKAKESTKRKRPDLL